MKIWAVLVSVLIAPCTWSQTPAGPDEALQRVARADNAFGLRLLAETRKASPGANVFQSPAGLALALAMVENGASGETLRQMEHALQPEGMAADEWNQANKHLLDHLTGLDRRITLEIANSVWTQTGAAIKPGFVASAKKWYGAEASTVDFRRPATVNRINDWASENTHGKIPSILQPQLSPDTRLILLDAIYFKGTWETQFKKQLTRDQPFKLRSGQTLQHPRMVRKDKMRYLETADFQAVALPYASGQASLYVFLPKENLDELMARLTPEKWEEITKQFASREGTLELPRFKLENKFRLNGELQTLGLTRAFSRQAEFGGISAEKLSISDVVQKTFVEVNEEGTEAAAVTGITVRPSLVQRPTASPFTMIVDRPFYAAIRENATGLILFHGTIEDPSR